MKNQVRGLGVTALLGRTAIWVTLVVVALVQVPAFAQVLEVAANSSGAN